MSDIKTKEENWDYIISPKNSLIDFQFEAVWRYRDLLMMYVKRDFVTFYKQTILGPLWFFIQPFITSLMYVFIFKKMAGLSTDGVPGLLFYLAGTTFWNYFAECLNKTATTFKDNQNIFGKVYFPRLVVPLSIVMSSLLKLAIQTGIFLIFYVYFAISQGIPTPTISIILFPVLILLLAGLGLGFGLMISALTTKYRDLIFLLQFGIQLWMFATPVIYPLSSMSQENQFWIKLNPISSVIETYRTIVFNLGPIDWSGLGYSAAFTVVILLVGTVIFNRTEKTFMDTV